MIQKVKYNDIDLEVETVDYANPYLYLRVYAYKRKRFLLWNYSKRVVLFCSSWRNETFNIDNRKEMQRCIQNLLRMMEKWQEEYKEAQDFPILLINVEDSHFELDN